MLLLHHKFVLHHIIDNYLGLTRTLLSATKILIYSFVATKSSWSWIKMRKKKKQKFLRYDTRDYELSDYTFVCDICLTHVQDRTKHCRDCNRWTSEFDHHCKWLNNWIGDQNYRRFIYLIIISFILNLYTVILYIIYMDLISEYEDDSYKTRYDPLIGK